MRKDGQATFFHKISTDEEPHHDLRPKGELSWGKFNKSLATRGEYFHKRFLPNTLSEVVKSVFRSLADPELVHECLHGKMQNPNELFNRVIWNRVPKNVFVCYETLAEGVSDDVWLSLMGMLAR
jgi:hypothetical protein